MDRNDELIAELREWRHRLGKAKLAADDAREEYEGKRKSVREIERSIEEILEEVETGKSGRPIMDAINGAGRDGHAAGASPADRRAWDPRLDWRGTTIVGLLAGASVEPAICGRISSQLAGWRPQIRTAGELAEWLLGNDLGGLPLGDPEILELRRALAAFRGAYGWDDDTTWPGGIPVTATEIDRLDDDPPRPAEASILTADDAVAEARRRGVGLHGVAMTPAPLVNQAVVVPYPPGESMPDGGEPPSVAEWKSADLDGRLLVALGWQGVGDRLLAMSPPPDSAAIAAALKDAWCNVLPKQCIGYRVRTIGGLAFWMGEDSWRKPTLDGAALVDRVRRVLGLGRPTAGAAGPKNPARKGKAEPATAGVP